MLSKFSATLQNLHDPKRYQYQIQVVFNNLKAKSALFNTFQHDVPFFNFGFDQKKLANILAKTVREESYVLSPAKQRMIVTPTKRRLVYEFCLTDKLVIGVIARLLNEITVSLLPKQVYSYRPKVNALMAARNLARYIQELRTRKQCRGVYIFKTDLTAYTDTVNVQESSPLWDQLQVALAQQNAKPTAYQWQLIKSSLRPECINLDGLLQSNLYGVPTGSPITSFLNNFYVLKIDQLFSSVPGLFYARYGDDILLCHDNPDEILKLEVRFDELLNYLSLSRNPKKDLHCYLSPAGNLGPVTGWVGSNNFQFLGYRVAGNGSFSLSSKRQRDFLRALLARLDNTVKLTHSKQITMTQQASLLCQTINQALVSPVFAEQRTLNLIIETSDHSQLQMLDYRIALAIAERLTHRRGVKAFREISYVQLRQQFNLLSLIQLRNLN